MNEIPWEEKKKGAVKGKKRIFSLHFCLLRAWFICCVLIHYNFNYVHLTNLENVMRAKKNEHKNEFLARRQRKVQKIMLNKEAKKIEVWIYFHSSSFEVNFMKYFKWLKINLVERAACIEIKICLLSFARLSICRVNLKLKRDFDIAV